MSLETLLSEVRRRRITLRIEGEELKYTAPEGEMDETLKTAIRERRGELIEVLGRTRTARRHIETICPVPDAGESAVFVHAVDGGVAGYVKLASLLRPHVTSFGAVARNFELKPTLPPSIPEIASTYVDELLSLAPPTVRIVAGWSNGGWIALEMGIELQRRGLSLPHVFVLDTTAEPRWHGPAPRAASAGAGPMSEEDQDWWRFIDLHLDATTRHRFPRSFWSLGTVDRARFLLCRARDASVVSRSSYLWLAKTPAELLFLKDMTNHLLKVMYDYSPSTYPGRLTVIFSEREVGRPGATTAEEAHIRRLWQDRSADTGFHKIVGHHSSVVRSPGVEHVAQVMLDALSGAPRA